MLIVAALFPQGFPWRPKDLGHALLIESLVYMIGFFAYKPGIIRNNLRNFRKRWHWNVDRVKVLKDVVILSWIIPLFAVIEVTKKVSPLIWGTRVVITESILLVGAALIFFGRIVFLNDGDEMWPDHMWNEEDERTPLWKNFDTLKYFFPLPLIGLICLVFKNGPGLVGGWYKDIARKMCAFATMRGLDPNSGKSEYRRWWMKTLWSWGKSSAPWILGVMKIIGIHLLHMGGSLLYWLLKPSGEFRGIVFLVDVLIFLIWSQFYQAQHRLGFLAGGVILGWVHVTFGYWLADQIERNLDKSDKRD
jgi:hypothetical protein